MTGNKAIISNFLISLKPSKYYAVLLHLKEEIVTWEKLYGIFLKNQCSKQWLSNAGMGQVEDSMPLLLQSEEQGSAFLKLLPNPCCHLSQILGLVFSSLHQMLIDFFKIKGRT